MSAKKIGDIKEQLKSITDSQLAQFIEAYGSDERGGVIKLVDSAKKRLDKYEKELIRTEGLKKYEREYASYAHICGIDEVGRGPLAGPVVACAVILPKDCDILYINDSKKLTTKPKGGGHWYEFTSDEEKKKTGIKGFFTKKTISVASSVLDSPAWHCPHCKKILMWMNAKEP